MGRPERPVAGTNPAVIVFATQLRALRSAAGNPTYRVMARRAYASRTCLSAAASGQQLPTLTMALAFVRACGGDVERWRAKWSRAYAASKLFEAGAAAPGVGRAARRVATADRRELVGSGWSAGPRGAVRPLRVAPVVVRSRAAWPVLPAPDAGRR